MAYTHLRTWSTYYAQSGTSTPSSHGNDAKGYVKVYYEQDKTNNKTNIKIDSYLAVESLPKSKVRVQNRCNKGSYGGTYQTLQYAIGTDGLDYGDYYVGTQTFSVTHNEDGTCQLYVNGRFEFEIPEATRTYSFNAALPTIPKASTITNNTSESSTKEFGTNVTFTVSKPATSTTNTLTYQVGGTTYTIASASSDTSISYAFPTSLISNFSGATPTITVTCTNSYNVSSTTTVYLKYPQSFAPTVSIALQDTGQTKLNGYWVQNKSKLKGTITATPKTGASITNYSASVSGYNYTYEKTPFETNDYLTVSGNRTVTYSATDSRGLTGTGTKSIYVIPYFTPTINNAKAERCTSDGTLSDSGTYVKVTVQYQVSELKDSGGTNHNTKSLGVSVLVGTETKTGTIPLSSYSGTATKVFNTGVSENGSYNFVFTLTDIFSSTTFTYAMGTAFKLESKKAGGKGIAFGKIATRDGMDINMDTYYKEDKVAFTKIGATKPNNAELWVKHSKNLFNKNNYLNIEKAYAQSANKGIFAHNDTETIVLACKPNTNYTVSKLADAVFTVGTTSTYPAVGTSLIDVVDTPTASSITLKTSSTARYMVIWFIWNGQNTHTKQELINSLQVEYGTSKSDYEEFTIPTINTNNNGTYNKLTDTVSVASESNNAGLWVETSKNLFDINNSKNNFVTTQYTTILYGKVKLINGKKYTFSFNDSTSGNVYYFNENYFKETSRITSNGGRKSMTLTCIKDSDGNTDIGLIKNANSQSSTPNITYVQIEEGSQATEYETFALPTIKINNNGIYEELGYQTIYSSNETIIGKWIDGKTLYRKVLTYQNSSTIGAKNATTNISIAHGISNLGTCIKKEIIHYSNYILPIAGGTTSGTISSWTGITQVGSTNINLRIINDTWSATTWRIILEYTKSTDTVSTLSLEED